MHAGRSFDAQCFVALLIGAAGSSETLVEIGFGATAMKRCCVDSVGRSFGIVFSSGKLWQRLVHAGSLDSSRDP